MIFKYGLYGIATALAFALSLCHKTVHAKGTTKCRKFRDVRYQKLPKNIRTIAKKYLKYTSATWNHKCVGNPIEDIRYSKLGEDAMTQWGPFKGLPKYIIDWKLSKLGFPDAECWDDYTHYKGYKWDELFSVYTRNGKKVHQQLKSLGWNRKSWNGKSNIPAVDCYLWKDLNKLQQRSAANLGYTDKEWDAHTCRPYCNAPTSTPSGAPSDMPSMMPSPSTEAPSAFPSSTPSDFPSSTPSVFPSDKPSSSPSSEPSALPSEAPSGTPSAQPSNEPTITPPEWRQVGQQINGKAESDNMGISVALSPDGTYWAGGIPNDKTNGDKSGAVSVYTFSSGSWNQVGSDIHGKAAYETCGMFVSISSNGKIVAIGCNGIQKSRVYSNTSGDWIQIGSDLEGQLVSLSSDGTIVAIGNPSANADGTQKGIVQVHSFATNVWTQIGTDIQGKTDNEQFGTSVDLSSDGSVVAIGAPYYHKDNYGLTRVYSISATEDWEQVGSDIEGATYAQTGASVSLSLDGTFLAVGSPTGKTTSNIDAGIVRVYSSATGEWVLEGSQLDGITKWRNFGNSVSLSSDGTILAVGCRQGLGPSGNSHGYVQVFSTNTKNSNDWVELGDPIYGEEKSFFGNSVALSSDGTTFVVGASSAAITARWAGAVLVYNYGTD